MATLTHRFTRVRDRLTMRDFALDGLGKFALGFGVGVLVAEAMAPWAWWVIAAGGALSATVKLKHWRTFWS